MESRQAGDGDKSVDVRVRATCTASPRRQQQLQQLQQGPMASPRPAPRPQAWAGVAELGGSAAATAAAAGAGRGAGAGAATDVDVVHESTTTATTAAAVAVGAACTAVADPAEASHAMVVFSYTSPFTDLLKARERHFDMAGRLLRITQGWKADGKGGSDIGFGASVYPSAIVLADYLDRHRDIVAGRTCVELGAGLGLPSIVASIVGAGRVFVTDGDLKLLEQTRANVASNLTAAEGDRVTVMQHMWGDFESKQGRLLAQGVALPHSEAHARAGPGVRPVDRPGVVVFGADIAACPYAGALKSLQQSIAKLTSLGGAGSTVIIAYQARNAVEEVFFRRMAVHFTVRDIPESEWHHDFRSAARRGLRLVRFDPIDPSSTGRDRCTAAVTSPPARSPTPLPAAAVPAEGAELASSPTGPAARTGTAPT